VITWDADAEKDARDFFINQATPQGIGYTLTDEAARILNNQGDFAIITASLSAANQNEWIKYIKERLALKYPKMNSVAIQQVKVIATALLPRLRRCSRSIRA